jgi:hypothetical protein
MTKSIKIKAGQLVEVRSKEEILATLDKSGRLDGLPFMPEMFTFCGKTFRVYKRAHKTCDTVFPVRGRRMANAVHLETRCDGQAHGGCQAGCLIFWKVAWLKPVSNSKTAQERIGAIVTTESMVPNQNKSCNEQNVWAGTNTSEQPNESEPTYICQATQLPYATTSLSWWDIRQYIEDYTSRNVGIWRILKGAIFSGYYHLSQAGIGLGRVMRWFYDKFHPLWRGTPYPCRTGTIPAGKSTPAETLNLQPGEFVRVKKHDQILNTLTTERKNRGMYFDAEMVPYCGGTYRVLKRVSKIIDEKTGKMTKMKNEAVILEGVVCQARYSNCRMFCPRAIYPYWREIWLERVSAAPAVIQVTGGEPMG